jgi:hypothetical protein
MTYKLLMVNIIGFNLSSHSVFMFFFIFAHYIVVLKIAWPLYLQSCYVDCGMRLSSCRVGFKV